MAQPYTRINVAVDVRLPDAEDDVVERRTALRQLALDFQAVTRALRYSSLTLNAPPAQLDSLCDSVRRYSVLASRSHHPPERVLVHIKTITEALSGSVAPSTVDSLSQLVLQAFLAGYYGNPAAGTRQVAGTPHRWRR